jgi:alginate O-acetyltransferase complex protein AlgJ
MFKRYIRIFGISFCILFSFFPVCNVLTHDPKNSENWYSKKVLFNFDALLSGVTTLLSVFHITPYGEKVLLGKDGWMFLGDEFFKTLTYAYRGVLDRDIKKNAIYTYEALLAWDAYFKAKGIPFFKIMIIPDKHTIYPEFLPDWLKLAPQSMYDYLLSHDKQHLFIDLKKIFLSKKKRMKNFFYWRVDSHWNEWGGAIAAKHLTDFMANQGMKNLKQLPEALFYPFGSAQSHDGDLLRLSRIKEQNNDSALWVNYFADNRLISQSNFKTNEKHEVSIQKEIIVDHDPIVMTSKSALNKKRLIWMRDSFGEMIKVPLFLMFSDVLQWKQTEAFDQSLFNKIINEWGADGVLYTLVERHLTCNLVQSCPPINKLSPPADLIFASRARYAGYTEAKEETEKSAYEGTEEDSKKAHASINATYQFKDPLVPRADHYLMVDFPASTEQMWTMTLSWEGDTSEEDKDIKFSHRKVIIELSAGKQLIHLGAAVGWRGYEKIKQLHLSVVLPAGSEIELPESLWITKIPFPTP